MKKEFKSKQRRDEKQIEFKHSVPAESNKGVREWYGCVSTKESNVLLRYETRFRGSAVRVFESEAKQLGGKLTTVGVF